MIGHATCQCEAVIVVNFNLSILKAFMALSVALGPRRLQLLHEFSTKPRMDWVTGASEDCMTYDGGLSELVLLHHRRNLVLGYHIYHRFCCVTVMSWYLGCSHTCHGLGCTFRGFTASRLGNTKATVLFIGSLVFFTPEIMNSEKYVYRFLPNDIMK